MGFLERSDPWRTESRTRAPNRNLYRRVLVPKRTRTLRGIWRPSPTRRTQCWARWITNRYVIELQLCDWMNHLCQTNSSAVAWNSTSYLSLRHHRYLKSPARGHWVMRLVKRRIAAQFELSETVPTVITNSSHPSWNSLAASQAWSIGCSWVM